VLVPLIGLRRGTERRLRIWSAACCTGEEPYSIAIVLNQIIPDLDTWNITIIGTDINPVFVQRARAGLYRDWSFRATPRWIKQKYFKASTDGNLEILPCIKRMVSFSCLNLAEDVFPEASVADDAPRNRINRGQSMNRGCTAKYPRENAATRERRLEFRARHVERRVERVRYFTGVSPLD